MFWFIFDLLFLFFFFFKQKTAYEMRISDWSSDVCSSDLLSFDEDGFAVVKPYVSPQDRGAEFTYRDNELSVMYPEVMQELDLFTIPNRWILTVADTDRDTIVVDFTNAEPATPTRTVRRGRTLRSEQRRLGKEWVSTVSTRWT